MSPATAESRLRASRPGAGLMTLIGNDPPADPPACDVMELAERFLSPEHAGPKFLLGRNVHSAALLELMRIDGIVDDYYPEDRWHDRPIVKCSDVPKNAIVANCSMSISPVTSFRRLQQSGLLGCVFYADLHRASPQRVPAPSFVSDTRNDVSIHEQHWLALFGRVREARSKIILRDLLRYRMSADPRYMADYAVRLSDQYFEDFLQLRSEVFVDAGGYDGSTTAEFCARYPDYRRVILFEPSPTNMRDARARLANQRDVEFIEQGLSHEAGTLAFDPDAGSASTVQAGGSLRIDVVTLDGAVGQPVSFIKMDLEGWELNALQGARAHILEDHPKLAVSVYHAAADFWRVPEYILGLRADYDLYLRHYTEGWSETVMFFVPR
jgi:FkbM family methyltransferase